MKVRINSNLYAKAFKEGWLTSLSYYVFLSSKFPNKKFNKKQALKLMSEGAFNKQSVILNSKGLLSYSKKNNRYRLGAHKEIISQYGGSLKLVTKNTQLNEIKIFLHSVPFLSNLNTQKKKVKKSKDHNTLIAKGPNYVRTDKELKKYNRALKKGSVTFDNEITLSIEGIKKVCNVNSNQKAIKIKKFLIKQGYVNAKRKIEELVNNVSKEVYLALKQSGTIPNYSKYNGSKRFIFIDRATQFFLPKKGFYNRFNEVNTDSYFDRTNFEGSLFNYNINDNVEIDIDNLFFA